MPLLRKIFGFIMGLVREPSQPEPVTLEPVVVRPTEKKPPKPNNLFPQFPAVFNNLKNAYKGFSHEADDALEHICADFLQRWATMKNRSSFEGLEDAVNQWRENDAGYKSLFADSSINNFSPLERLYDEAFPPQEELTANAEPILVEV